LLYLSLQAVPETKTVFLVTLNSPGLGKLKDVSSRSPMARGAGRSSREGLKARARSPTEPAKPRAGWRSGPPTRLTGGGQGLLGSGHPCYGKAPPGALDRPGIEIQEVAIRAPSAPIHSSNLETSHSPLWPAEPLHYDLYLRYQKEATWDARRRNRHGSGGVGTNMGYAAEEPASGGRRGDRNPLGMKATGGCSFRAVSASAGGDWSDRAATRWAGP
jgi:hypothetical protein